MTSYGGGSYGEEWAWAFDTGFLNFGGLMDDGSFLSQRTCDTVCRIGASHQVCGNSCWWVCADRLRTRATGVGGRDNGGKPNQVLGIIPCEIGRERTDLFSPVFLASSLGPNDSNARAGRFLSKREPATVASMTRGARCSVARASRRLTIMQHHVIIPNRARYDKHPKVAQDAPCREKGKKGDWCG